MFVGLGAVVTIGAKNQECSQDRTGLAELPEMGQEAFLDVPLECLEVVGRSLLERLIERFVAIDVERVSILVEASTSMRMPQFRTDYANVTVKVVRDLYPAIAQELADFSRNGISQRHGKSGQGSLPRDRPGIGGFFAKRNQALVHQFGQRLRGDRSP